MTTGNVEMSEEYDRGGDLDSLRRRREVVATFAALVLILGTVAGAAYYFLRPRPADLHHIVAVAEKAVEASVGPDLHCVFPFFEEMDVTAAG